ncbi:MAG: ABC transporter substrate-binding protein [Desulfomonilaceae bacterium]
MRRNVWAAFLSAVALLFVVCASASLAADTIKIGVLAPFKTPSGESLLKAAKMAADEINEAGGILGKKIELITANTEYKPQVGATAYKKFALQDKCDVVFGTCSSGVAQAVMDQMARYKVPFISTGAASEVLAEKYAADKDKFKYWFRVMHQSSDLTDAIHQFIWDLPVQKTGAKRMAIMAENALWTRDMVKAAEQFFKEKHLETVYSEFFDGETKDFTPIFTKIMNAKADFIYEISAHVDGAIYIKQWFDLKGPMIAGVSGTGASDRYWKDSGGKAVGETLIAMGSFRVPLTPKSIPFFDKYMKLFGETPGYTSGYTYDALYIYKDAVEKAKGTAADKLVPVLEKTDYVGVVGRWVFTDLHNARYGEGYRQLPMVQWREDGSRDVVWPKNLATNEYKLAPWLEKK